MVESKGPEERVSAEERNWATLAHLTGLALFLLLPGVNILGPLLIWRLKKDELPFVGNQAMEALNFQITVSICLLSAYALILLVSMVYTLLTALIFLIPLIGVIDIVIVVLAAMKTTQGERYHYPLSWRIIR